MPLLVFFTLTVDSVAWAAAAVAVVVVIVVVAVIAAVLLWEFLGFFNAHQCRNKPQRAHTRTHTISCTHTLACVYVVSIWQKR